MRYLLAVSLLLLSAPAFADDANILELQLEIQRLLNEGDGVLDSDGRYIPETQICRPFDAKPRQGVEICKPDLISPFVPEVKIQPAQSKPAFTKRPPLSIHVWPFKSCVHGERAIAAIVPKLNAQGWVEGQHYEIVREWGGSCPQFFWKGRSFGSGWSGWEAWNAELRSVMGVSQSRMGSPADVAASVTAPVRRAVASAGVSSVPRDPRPGHWSFPGDIRSHLMRPPHNFSAADLAGLSYEQLLTLHDLNHERGYRPQRMIQQPRTTYAAPVTQSFCPTCPGYRR